jgi:hypothetical protein
MIVIQPWDPNAVKDIEKAILTSDIGLQPLIEGKLIRLSVPHGAGGLLVLDEGCRRLLAEAEEGRPLVARVHTRERAQ